MLVYTLYILPITTALTEGGGGGESCVDPVKEVKWIQAITRVCAITTKQPTAAWEWNVSLSRRLSMPVFSAFLGLYSLPFSACIQISQ